MGPERVVASRCILGAPLPGAAALPAPPIPTSDESVAQDKCARGGRGTGRGQCGGGAAGGRKGQPAKKKMPVPWMAAASIGKDSCLGRRILRTRCAKRCCQTAASGRVADAFRPRSSTHGIQMFSDVLPAARITQVRQWSTCLAWCCRRRAQFSNASAA